MTTPDYNCNALAGIDKATCSYFQDVAITHYMFIGYLEIIIVGFLFYIVVYKILFKWVFSKFVRL